MFLVDQLNQLPRHINRLNINLLTIKLKFIYKVFLYIYFFI